MRITTQFPKQEKTKNKTVILEDTTFANYTEDEFYDALEYSSNIENIENLEKALLQLPVEESLLIMMFYNEKKNIEELALITGLSPSNVKVRLHRTRKKLSSMLAPTYQ